MSMSKKQANKTIVYFRKRKTNETVKEVANVVASSAQQEAKTIEEGRAYCPDSSMLNIQSKGGGAVNAKTTSDNLEKERNTWNPYDESTKESLLVQPTQQETNEIQLPLVHKRNIDYAIKPLEFAKDLGGTAQRLANTRVRESTLDAREGNVTRKENNKIMSIADNRAQRENKGISISERSHNSRSEEMAKFLGTSNDHSSGQNLQFQNMNLVSPNYLLIKPSTIVHPSRIIGPSRFSPNHVQKMQRASVSAPRNFSSMNLLKGNENTSTLTGEKLLNDQGLLSTDQGLSPEEQRLLQSPNSQVGNYQSMQRKPDFSYQRLLTEGEDISTLTYDLYGTQPPSTQLSLSLGGQRVQQLPTSQVGNDQLGKLSVGQKVQQLPISNYQFGDSSAGQRVKKLPVSQVGNDLFGNSSAGKTVQQRPIREEGNDQLEKLSAGQMVQQLPTSQVGNDQPGKLSVGQKVQQLPISNYQFGDSSAGQRVKKLPVRQVGNDLFGNSSAGKTVQQRPISEERNDQFEKLSAGQMVQQLQINSQNHQNQVLPQPEEISFRELLARDDISYMDLLTREDLQISWI